MQQCDVLLVALADITRDARTANLADALAQRGLSVEVLGAFSEDINATYRKIVWEDPGGRALRRWWSLTRMCSAVDLRPKIVIAMDVFALAGSAAIVRKSGARLFYDMRELNFALGPLQGRGIKQTIITRHEERQLRSVHTIMVSGELDADLVQQRFRLKKRPLVLLNTPPYKEVVPSPLRQLCKLAPDVPLVIYQGVVHHGRGIAPFYEAMKLMPDVHLAIVGDGPALTELQSQSRQLGVSDRVHWLGSVPYNELHSYTCGADIGLCLIEPLSLSYEYALPNKLFEYMNARIPSIVTDLPAMRQHLDIYPIGMLVNRVMDPEEIVRVTRGLLSGDVRRSCIDACGAIRELSHEHQVHSVSSAIEQTLHSV